jgi:hypothetical protein
MKPSLQELIRWQQQGTLESHLLSQGLIPLQVLSSALEQASDTIEQLGLELARYEEE